MCGIGGILAKQSATVPEKALQKMSLALAHRGPDDSGVYLSSNRKAGLVHRRLSIIDLSKNASQPMTDASGKNHVIYNGEIYNYQELRQPLLRKYRFRTQSYTEVILALYAGEGSSFLRKLRGMFAFALWDEEKQTLLLTRDRLGIKPLYYAETEDFFLFASETRAIVAAELLPKEIDLQAFSGFLSFGSVPSPRTLFQKIRSLPPSGLLSYRNGQFEIRSFESFSRTTDGNPASWEMAELAGKLNDAVKSHLIGDVPVGLFLSGGVDSTAITALARQFIPGELKTFSITFPGNSLDEGMYAKLAAEQFATQHIEAPVTARDFLEAMPKILTTMDQPTVDGVNTFFVSRLVRESGIKVVLSGLGGDELFAGYPSFRLLPRLCGISSILRKLPLGMTMGKSLLGLLPQTNRIKSVLEFLELGGTPIAGYFVVRKLFLESEKEKLLLLPTFNLEEEKFNPLEYLSGISKNGTGSGHPALYAERLETRGYLHNQLLRDTDMMGMAHGIEIRVPFLDQPLVDYAGGIPMEEKLTKQPKALLLSALQGKIPAQIAHRRKMGFTFPFDSWFRGDLRPLLTAFFQEGPSRETRHFWNWPSVGNVWEDFLDHRAHWSRPWSIYVLENWLRLRHV